MGVLVSQVFTHQGRVLPKKLPAQEPDFFSDFEHDSDLPDWWATVGGTWGIANGLLRQTSLAGGLYYAYMNQGPVFDDFLYEARVRAVTPGINPWDVPWINPRYQGLNDNYYCSLFQNNSVHFGRRVAGVTTDLDIWGYVGLVTDWHTYRIHAIGNTFMVYIDGVYLGTSIDPLNSFMTGRLGLETLGGPCTADFDDVFAKRLP